MSHILDVALPWMLLYVGRAYLFQDASKGGAVETGCSRLHYVIGCCLYIYIYIYDTTPIHCIPLRLHPPLMNTQSWRLAILDVER